MNNPWAEMYERVANRSVKENAKVQLAIVEKINEHRKRLGATEIPQDNVKAIRELTT